MDNTTYQFVQDARGHQVTSLYFAALLSLRPRYGLSGQLEADARNQEPLTATVNSSSCVFR